MDAQTVPQKLLVLNGLNFQLRIDVWLVESGGKSWKFPVKRDYSFDVEVPHDGTFELLVQLYDFALESGRFTVVKDQNTTVYAGNTTVPLPLELRVTGFHEYYESPQGKLNDMLRSSPLGFIFRSKAYTIMFLACVAIMVGPWILGLVAPGVVEQFQQIQREAYEKKYS